MTKAERIELEATLATILGISSPDQKFSITIEGFTYKDITMRTHLADVMLIQSPHSITKPFKVTTEHIIDLDPEEDPDDEEDDEIIESLGEDLADLLLRTFGEKK